MPSIADAVAQVQATDLPVLFADTCSLLDVIRAPLRPDELSGCVEAALELMELLNLSPLRCTLVVASFVRAEWKTHAGPEADRLRAHLVGVDKSIDRLNGLCGLLGIAPPFPKPEYSALPLVDRLPDLSRRLLDGALHLDPDHDCIFQAYGRASTHTPPSLKGGEIKDATIIEECLEVSRRLQATGFTRKRVFCTSNRRDYCETGSRLHPLLDVDFGTAGLGFVTTLPWAAAEIKKT